jgi:HTH-type transcriptional regulator, cell division transcriptional repressor
MKRTKNIVGRRVRIARAKSKPLLTQKKLSALVIKNGTHIDRAGIAKIETGIRCVLDYEVPALAKALGVSVAWLLSGRR